MKIPYKKTILFRILLFLAVFMFCFSFFHSLAEISPNSRTNIRARQERRIESNQKPAQEEAIKSSQNEKADKLYEEFKKLYESQRGLALDVAKKIILEFPDAIIIDSILNRITLDDLLAIAGELSLSNDLKTLDASVKILEKWLYRVENRIGVDNLADEFGKAPDVLFAAGNVERKISKLSNVAQKTSKYYSRIVQEFPTSVLGRLIRNEMNIYQLNSSKAISDDDYMNLMYQFIVDYDELEIIPQLNRHQYIKTQRICQALLSKYPESRLTGQIMFWNAESFFRMGEIDESVKLYGEYLGKYKEDKNLQYIKEWIEKEKSTREETLKILEDAKLKLHKKDERFNIEGIKFLVNNKLKGTILSGEKYKMLAFGSEEFPESKVILLDKDNSRVYYYLLFDNKLYTKESEHFAAKINENLDSLLDILNQIPVSYKQHIYTKEKKDNGGVVAEIAYMKPVKLELNFIRKDDVADNNVIILNQNNNINDIVFKIFTFTISKDSDIKSVVLSKDSNSTKDTVNIETIKIKEKNPEEYFMKKIPMQNEKSGKIAFEETEIFNQINDISEKLLISINSNKNISKEITIPIIPEGILKSSESKKMLDR